MPKKGTAALLICLLLAAPSLAAQHRSSGKSRYSPTPPGTTTITSFDQAHTVVGWLEVVPFQSKIFHDTRMLRVLVPANYFSPHNAHRSYPVLYLQDGQNLFDQASSSPRGEWHVDETIDHLVGSFKLPPMFVVGIDNAGEKSKASEYLPYPDPKNEQDKFSDANSVHGKEYARFLLTEVIPFIEKYYRVSRGPVNTGLGGASYAADAALYTVLEHPGLFGHLLLESPELEIGDGQLLKDVQKARLLPQRIYVGVGAAERPSAVEGVQELEKILHNKGLGKAQLKVIVEKGEEGNEAAWSRRLPDALTFLYGQ